jgi:branched-chain amino acid transport system permease protein
MNYFFHLAILLTIYLILSISLNMLVGYTGLLSLAHAAFYGIGAYTATLVMIRFKVYSPLVLLASIGLAILFSVIIAVPSLRLKGDYFVLASLGFQVIIFNLLHNWATLTNGALGISGIPRPTALGINIHSVPIFLIFSSIMSMMCILIMIRLLKSPFGRILKAIREDELATLSMGKNITAYKIQVFIITCSNAAIAGGLYAWYVSFIDPTSFNLNESIFMIAVVLIGGSGNIKGPIVGTFIMLLLPEVLRFFHMPDNVAANFRQMVFGMLLILLMRFRPQGIAGEYKFE